MYKIGDIVKATWRDDIDCPIGIIVSCDEGPRFRKTYNVKWFASNERDGNFLDYSIQKVDNAG